MKFASRLLYIFAVLALLPVTLSAQEEEPADSLVRLLSADFMQSIEVGGVTWRKIFGKPARFLHNNTYLMCDTALWNVDAGIIEANKNVKILQDQTVLTSDKMTYLINQDLAEFNGHLVELYDKDNNTLRTNFLYYNTKDSVATFEQGAAMRDKDGQIIESTTGVYDSKARTFEFSEDVNMFIDSAFVKTSYVKYEADKSIANFGAETYMWQDEYMLASDAGWYNREKELFFFRIGVHLMSDKQEGWCDTLYVERPSSNVTMLGNVQLSDSTRHVTALAGRMDYVDSISTLTMSCKPAIIAETDEEGKRDTVYFASDTLIYYTLPMCDIPKSVKEASDKRKSSAQVDPVAEYRKAAAEAAAKAAQEAADNDPNNPEGARRKNVTSLPARQQRPPRHQDPDSLMADTPDSATVKKAPENSDNKDTTKVGFLLAKRNIRFFRGNMQGSCDSLTYSELDSIACLYSNPIVWNEGTHQYNSDSMYVVIRNSTINRASLMSNAFIHIERDTTHYDQIRGSEMTAYFGKKGKLSRFDALGGASALFYLEENEVLATVNKSEAKMLSASFKSGNIQTIYYYDTPKSNAYPSIQLKREEARLKGFNWQGEKRPASPSDVTERKARPLARAYYSAIPRAKYSRTDKYFPGYMDGVYRAIEIRDSMKIVRERERKERERIADSLAVADSLFRVDSLFRADSLHKADSLHRADSIAKADALARAVADSIARANKPVVPDAVVAAEVPTPEELEQERKDSIKNARLDAKKAKEAAREAKWKAKDEADAARAAVREQKLKEKKRKETLKELQAARAREEKEKQILDRYTHRFAKQKSRQEAAGKKARKSKQKGKIPNNLALPEVVEDLLPDKKGDDILDNL